MKNSLIIEMPTEEYRRFLYNRVVEDNEENFHGKKSNEVKRICRIIKDCEGNVIAGILTTVLPWNDLEIHELWADEGDREEELKVELLNEVEKEFKKMGAV